MESEKPSISYNKRESKLSGRTIHPFSEIWQFSKKIVENAENINKEKILEKHRIIIDLCKWLNDFIRIYNYINKDNIKNRYQDSFDSLFCLFNDILKKYNYEFVFFTGKKWSEISKDNIDIVEVIDDESATEAIITETTEPLIKFHNDVINNAKLILLKPPKKEEF